MKRKKFKTKKKNRKKVKKRKREKGKRQGKRKTIIPRKCIQLYCFCLSTRGDFFHITDCTEA